MSENTFLSVIWIGVVAIMVALISSSALYYNSKNDKMLEAIKAGGDPIAVACAFEEGSTACLIVKK